MKALSSLVLAGLSCLIALPSYAICTPEDAMVKAEEAAHTIHRVAGGDPEKAAALHEKLLALQERDPTRSDDGACEAYDKIIREVKKQEGQSGS